MEHFVSELLAASGLSAVELAQRSGVSRSTQFRIDKGLTDPRWGSLSELAIAAGFDADVTLRPLSDPDAARAARILLDAAYPPQASERALLWMRRLERTAGSDPVGVVRFAGQSSSLLHREGAVFLAGSADDLKLAAAGANSGADWILSGRGALERLSPDTSSLGRTARVVYAADVHRVVRSLNHLTPSGIGRADVIVAPYDADLSVDELIDGHLRFVAPIQAVIDAFGLGDDAAALAASIAGSW